jgi:hypothetical protein
VASLKDRGPDSHQGSSSAGIAAGHVHTADQPASYERLQVKHHAVGRTNLHEIRELANTRRAAVQECESADQIERLGLPRGERGLVEK